MPSISGASRWVRPDAGRSTSTSTSRPIRRSRRAAVMASCSSVSSASRSRTRAAGTWPSRSAANVPSSRRVGEEPAPVELGLLDEAEQLVVVGLGLARVADDEVAAERGLGLAGADVLDAAQEAVAVAPAPHPPQQWLADVLQREVEVRDAGGADGVDQRRRSGRSDRGTAAGPGRRGRRRRRTSGTIEPRRRGPRDGCGPCRSWPGPGRRARSRGRRARRPRPGSTSTVRLRWGPRNEGMAQKPQARSHPSAIFT